MVDRYPTHGELLDLRKYPIRSQADIDALWNGVRELWYYPDRIAQVIEPDALEWPLKGCDWAVSTGGWSGNEDVIGALQKNFIFWSLCWRVSAAGGHYWFRIAGRIRRRSSRTP